MMKRPKPKTPPQLPTEAELEILNVLWAAGPSTVREVHSAIDKTTGYTTVLKQMQIMVEKGLLDRSERFRSHIYEARAPRLQTQRHLASNLLHRAFAGSAKDLVLGALSAQRVSAQELDEIRRMLDAYQRGAK